MTDKRYANFIRRQSFIELDARERATALFDAGTSRELLGPFDRVESPWLAMQGVTPQADDGCVVMKGKIAGQAAVVVALEGAFQGGSMGEVSGEKMTAALDLAYADSKKGTRTSAVVLLETGGVRLQEANLGLAAIAELLGSILLLRKYAPVICLSAGTVGSFGGMSLAAGLASYVVMTREARLGLNGPEVIEQENGIDEFDSSDHALVWAIDGGEQRFETGLVDALVEDDTPQVVEAIRRFVGKGVPAVHRSSEVELYRSRIKALDTSQQWDPKELRARWAAKSATEGKQ
jgi:malonate decarboxylase beta subunit